MKNITLRRYTVLPSTLEYDSILEHLQPANNFRNRQMNSAQMPYSNVKYCIKLLPKIYSWQCIQQLF